MSWSWSPLYSHAWKIITFFSEPDFEIKPNYNLCACKTTFFNFSRTPITINSRKAAVGWFRGFAIGTCSCSSYSDRECLTISVLCSQITDIVSYRRTLRAWYMAAWDTFIGQDHLPEVSSRKVPMPVLFYLYAPAGFSNSWGV